MAACGKFVVCHLHTKPICDHVPREIFGSGGMRCPVELSPMKPPKLSDLEAVLFRNGGILTPDGMWKHTLPESASHLTFEESVLTYHSSFLVPPVPNGFRPIDTHTFESEWPPCVHRKAGFVYAMHSGFVSFKAVCHCVECPLYQKELFLNQCQECDERRTSRD